MGTSFDVAETTVPDILLRLALLAFVLWVVWYVVQPKSVFVIGVVDGNLLVLRGVVPGPMLTEIGRVCHQHRLPKGRIRGIKPFSGPIKLVFSRDFPPGVQQQVRNAWVNGA
jgi:hypothetical protein